MFKLKKLLTLTALALLLCPLKSNADFEPLKDQIKKCQSILSENETISKDDLRENLEILMDKASFIENEIASSDINTDLALLMKKYVDKNSNNTIKSKELSYWIKHLYDDLDLFKKMGITG